MALIKNVKENDYVIYNYDDNVLKQEIKPYKCIKIGFSFQEKIKNSINIKNNFIYDLFDRKLIDLKKVLIPGNHNILNSNKCCIVIENSNQGNLCKTLHF